MADNDAPAIGGKPQEREQADESSLILPTTKKQPTITNPSRTAPQPSDPDEPGLFDE